MTPSSHLLNRKKHATIALFAGSAGGAGRWAIIASLIRTGKLDGVELFAWLRDSLAPMIEGNPASRFDELLPWPVVGRVRLR